MAVAADPTGGHRSNHGWRIVAALAVTSTIGYGVLYYAFAVLLRPMADALHASTAAVTGALTASVLAGAVMSVPVGRWLDRHGGRALMTTGSVAATLLVLAWSQVHTIGQLYAVLIGIGITSAMVLYEPAFAVVVSWFDPQRRPKALLAVVLVAGFASTIFMPLTAVLVDRHGWRTTLIVLGVLYGALAIPLHALVVRRPPAGVAPGGSRRRAEVVRAALRDGRFWLLTVAFVAHATATGAMTVHLVGFLVAQGHPATFAATVAGLLGVLSVTGRLVLTAVQRRVRLTTVVAVIFTVQAAAALSLPAIASSRIGAAVGVTAFGIGFGTASLATPAILADRYGTTAYATVAGTIAAPVIIARALAPTAAAALLGIAGDYRPVLIGIGVASLVAAIGVTARAGSPSPIHEQTGESAEP
ncbi:MFS transporter [Virgisporangium aliadipatigenens]|uniref:MFS transporter n=1 Tax=Virgisporangium aliadipatigenens TaxID=741659 RepID=A0A8J3YVE9_9ACTN|nr:MFS transporter [Virgisporangium aliadipatigenens]